MRSIALTLAILLAGCHAPAGRRMAQDAFVVATSPVQIPVMAARDAARNYDDPVISTVMFPLTFTLFAVEHTFLTVAHAGDLLIFPAHFLSERESLDIYRDIGLPLERGLNAGLFSEGVGTTLVFAVAIAGPVFYWIATADRF